MKWWALLLLTGIVGVTACSSSSNSGSGSGGQSVEIGIPFESNIAGLVANLGGTLPGGAKPPTDQQEQAYYAAVATYIDSHGGLLGHKIKLVFYGIDATKQLDASVIDEGECTSFTQDNHVFAVMTPTASDSTLITCLDNAKAITFDPASYTNFDDSMFSQYPLYATAGTLSLTRVAQVEVNGLYKQGFFDPGSKIGLVGYNTPAFKRAIDQVMEPALSKDGLSVTDSVLIAPTSGVADVAPAQTAMSNAVLRFKTEGINHVLFLDTQGGTLNPWMTAANSQAYYPRLGFTSNENPAVRASNAPGGASAKLLGNSVVVGWNASLDVSQPPTNATQTQCITLMENAGAIPAIATAFAGICNQLLVFAAGVNGGGQLTPTAALAGLGSAQSIPTAVLLSPPNYSGGRRDGASVGQYLAFTASCKCYQYTGSSFPLATLEG